MIALILGHIGRPVAENHQTSSSNRFSGYSVVDFFISEAALPVTSNAQLGLNSRRTFYGLDDVDNEGVEFFGFKGNVKHRLRAIAKVTIH